MARQMDTLDSGSYPVSLKPSSFLAATSSHFFL